MQPLQRRLYKRFVPKLASAGAFATEHKVSNSSASKLQALRWFAATQEHHNVELECLCTSTSSV